MAYIGRDISNLSDRAVLDSITTSATATYNLLLNSVAYVPSSAESLTVSLNGVIQKPQSSYTVSGSTIVFDSALTSSDVIDFILAERAITLTTVGSGTVNTSNIVDDAVTTAKINDGAITSAKLDSGLALGKIGQVVHSQQNPNIYSGATGYVDTGASATITPSSSSSKIIVILNSTAGGVRTGGENKAQFGLTRDNGATFLTEKRIENYDYGLSGTYNLTPFSIQYVDSPSTTSAITYKIYGEKLVATGFLFGTASDTDWILMEVLA